MMRIESSLSCDRRSVYKVATYCVGQNVYNKNGLYYKWFVRQTTIRQTRLIT